MEYRDLKEVADRLMAHQGRVRGEKFKNHASYIIQKEGREGLSAVESKINELGYQFKFDDIRSLDWYPVGFSPLIIIIAKNLFNWSDADVFDLGYMAPKFSFLFKMAFRWVVSIEKMAEESPSYWRKHYDFGEIEAVEINKEKKIVIARVSGFELDPVMCQYLQGYILRMLQYVIESQATIEESKCFYRGDDYDEFIIRWK